MAVVDISDPTAPFVVGSYTELFDVKDVVLSASYAYVANAQETGLYPDPIGGLNVLDLSDPSAPALVGNFQTHGVVIGVEIVGSRAYILDEGEGLIILDITDPPNPARQGNYHSPWRLRNAHKQGDLLYVTDQFNGISIVDVSDPGMPALRGVYQTSESSGRWGYNWGVDVRDGMAYLAAGTTPFDTLIQTLVPTLNQGSD